MQRIDRSYAEILQEVRVAQTGVQVLLAFLLTLAFTPRFTELGDGQRYLYVTTLVVGAVATALLMAPAAFHRIVFRQRLKSHLVIAANRFALFGLAALLVAKACALLLVIQFALKGTGISSGMATVPAAILTFFVVGWFSYFWFIVPAWCRYRHRNQVW
jgi:hypothetical protein